MTAGGLGPAGPVSAFERKRLSILGAGVSDSEAGAGPGTPSMPGGSLAAGPDARPICPAIVAQVDDDTPCCDLVSENGARGFVTPNLKSSRDSGLAPLLLQGDNRS